MNASMNPNGKYARVGDIELMKKRTVKCLKTAAYLLRQRELFSA